MRDSPAANLSAWMAWARQKLSLDTSEISELVYPPVTESPENGLDPAIPCDQAWNLLAHRLDVAGAAHPDIVDIPVFPMEKFSDYPTGMVRLNRNWLGDALMELGKKRTVTLLRQGKWCRERDYGIVYGTRCGLPPAWVSSLASDRYLIWCEQNLEIAAQIESNDHCIGPVVAVWHRATTCTVQ